ncbi:MAG TPA: type IV pilus assembly protein PilM [Methylomirabilota bacterium]|nr:type IV pilus assembly protein PilM [Methylomirabilota bacterium]
MLKTKSFLALDFGAGSLKLAEFAPNEAGGLRLVQYGIKSLGLEGSQEARREGAIQRALQELLSENPFMARDANICAPGFHVFSKFVKLPPVDTAKVTQIIQYEAQQNVPFPLEEVVWDYQILGTSASGELEVLLVAIKSDIVEGLFRVAEGAGIRLQLVDVSLAALCNAFRYNYGDPDGCTMLLDIGAKTSNLLFFEKGKVYARGINIGANSITQEFGNESKLAFAEAERLKMDQGFVSLGGAYEEPDNPQQAAISKIARQVMTRLHIQVNQTMQFYRGQQGGSAPERLYLSGGASIMPYTSQFFAEKLNVPVEYFNPFQNIQIDPSIDLEELAKVAHSMGEVVGLGLRTLAHCPVELNLMPQKSLRRQQFAQKKPYFIAAVFSLVAVIFAIGGFQNRLATLKRSELEKLNLQLTPLQSVDRQLRQAENRLNDDTARADQIATWMEHRLFWPDLLQEMRAAMIEAETKTQSPGQPSGVWVETFTPVIPGRDSSALAELPTASVSAPAIPASTGDWEMDPLLAERYGLVPPSGQTQPAEPEPDPFATPTPDMEGGEAAGDGTNSISVVNLVCRGINRNHISVTANSSLAYTVVRELKANPHFVAEETDLHGEIAQVPDDEETFTFGVKVKLKRPLEM